MRIIPVAHADIYRRTAAGIEFLAIKRAPRDGGFWQSVTGTLDPGEDIRTALRREIIEEVGIIDLLNVSEELFTYEWAWGMNSTGQDHCFAVEVALDTEIVLSHEHTHYRWLPFEKAVELIKYDGAKESLRRSNDYASGKI